MARKSVSVQDYLAALDSIEKLTAWTDLDGVSEEVAQQIKKLEETVQIWETQNEDESFWT